MSSGVSSRIGIVVCSVSELVMCWCIVRFCVIWIMKLCVCIENMW